MGVGGVVLQYLYFLYRYTDKMEILSKEEQSRVFLNRLKTFGVCSITQHQSTMGVFVHVFKAVGWRMSAAS